MQYDANEMAKKPPLREIFIDHYQRGKTLLREKEDDTIEVVFFDRQHHFIVGKNEMMLLEIYEENIRLAL